MTARNPFRGLDDETPRRVSIRPTRTDLLDPADELPEHATPFERAHHYGSRRHPEHWIRANQVAIDLAGYRGVDHTCEPYKTLLSQVVLRVLDVAKTGLAGRM